MTRAGLLASALCTILALLGISTAARAQRGNSFTGRVVDTQNSPIEGARILAANGSVLAVTDSAGQFTLTAGVAEIQITASGFDTAKVTISESAQPQIVLQPVAETQSVSVTAYMSPLS